MRVNRFTMMNGESGVGAVVTLVVVIVVGLLAWNYIVVPFWEKHIIKYDKPWWSGNEVQRVCNTTGDENCYYLPVESTGDEIEAIYFPNGGYITVYSWECAKAASGLGYDFDRFCRVWGADGARYDVMPQ